MWRRLPLSAAKVSLGCHLIAAESRSDGATARRYAGYSAYTATTPADFPNRWESETTLSFPPLCLTYYHATFMRLWDYIMMSMLDAHFVAAAVYLGTEDVPSSFQVELNEPRILLPAAKSAAFAGAPVTIVTAKALRTRRLQPLEEASPAPCMGLPSQAFPQDNSLSLGLPSHTSLAILPSPSLPGPPLTHLLPHPRLRAGL